MPRVLGGGTLAKDIPPTNQNTIPSPQLKGFLNVQTPIPHKIVSPISKNTPMPYTPSLLAPYTSADFPALGHFRPFPGGRTTAIPTIPVKTHKANGITIANP